ncbi:MAG: phosphoglycerate kinase [bacterium]|nr:phosphoglycerate kinase [bacterium]
MNKVTVADINFKNRTALVRVDFNVPLDSEQKITDDRRIQAAIPTLSKILSDGGKVIACSHLGRPKGKFVAEMSLRPVAARLGDLLSTNVLFAEDCIGPEASNPAAKLEAGDCLLLENLRFHQGETENDPDFAKKLASLADIFVNDAFGTAHRAHASTEGVTHHFNQSVAGFLMQKELHYLGSSLDRPVRPFAAILGGAKISGKIDVINSLMNKVDRLFVGGGMMFTFIKAMGHSIGDSLLEEDKVDLARDLMDQFKQSEAKLVLPVDCVIAQTIADDAETKVVGIDSIPDGWKGLDIGPKSVKLFGQELSDCKTVVWNGPMGVFESAPFAEGTFAIAHILASLTENGATTIVGGGDSAAAVSKASLDDRLSHISTGGGASLEFLEGKLLPGVEALTSAQRVETVKNA